MPYTDLSEATPTFPLCSKLKAPASFLVGMIFHHLVSFTNCPLSQLFGSSTFYWGINIVPKSISHTPLLYTPYTNAKSS